MKKKIEEAAQQYAKGVAVPFDSSNEERKAIAEQAFKAGVKWQGKQSPWISVKDRLPETFSVLGNESSLVLCHLTDEQYEVIGTFCSDGRWLAWMTLNGDTRIYSINVDYWMPIPNIPKGDMK